MSQQKAKSSLKNEKLMRVGFETGKQFQVDILPRRFHSEISDVRITRTPKRGVVVNMAAAFFVGAKLRNWI
jgi:hypothetical protein